MKKFVHAVVKCVRMQRYNHNKLCEWRCHLTYNTYPYANNFFAYWCWWRLSVIQVMVMTWQCCIIGNWTRFSFLKTLPTIQHFKYWYWSFALKHSHAHSLEIHNMRPAAVSGPHIRWVSHSSVSHSLEVCVYCVNRVWSTVLCRSGP